MSGQATIVAVILGYLLVLVLIGLWSRTESQDIAGYYVSHKKLPSWVVAFSSNATGESAWLLLGLTGMGYLVGVHAFWVVLGEVLGVSLAWALVGPRFKEQTDRFKSITVPDYLESRFDDRGHWLRWISMMVIVTMAATYTSAQLTASGKAFSSFMGTSTTTGVLIGAGVILFYTTIGGFKAVAYSDVLQGVLMFTGLLIMPIVGVAAAGGWLSMMDRLREIDPALLLPMGSAGLTLAGVMSAASFAGIGLAFLGAPQLLIRFISAKSRRTVADGGLIAVGCIIVFDVGAVLTGMAGRSLFPNLADSETIFPILSAELFPAVFTGLFLVLVLAAIMSTADSVLILASSAVVRDVLQKALGSSASDERLTLYGKVATAVIGAVALAFAFGEVPVIFWFVLFAWSGLGAAFTPVVLAGLFWRGTTRAGAIAGMLVGFGVTVGWVVFFKADFFNLYEMIPGFLAAFATILLVSLATRRTRSGDPAGATAGGPGETR